MTEGGSIVAMSYYGAEKVVPHYNVMGVAKASLEASTRYLAYDLGPKRIRVNCISAGPMNTLAARGIAGLHRHDETLRSPCAAAPKRCSRRIGCDRGTSWPATAPPPLPGR
jgi:enoyl-[acyl-carrier-protein] reductase (NADH)